MERKHIAKHSAKRHSKAKRKGTAFLDFVARHAPTVIAFLTACFALTLALGAIGGAL